jgi:hypothetical protein
LQNLKITVKVLKTYSHPLHEAIMTKGNKTRSQLILDALLTGKTLLLSDIRRMVSEASGKEVRVHDILKIRDAILPKLMKGEIRVKTI